MKHEAELEQELQAYLDFFVHIGEQDLSALPALVAQHTSTDFRFIDPFNSLQGQEAFCKLLDKTRRDVRSPSFEILAITTLNETDSERNWVIKWRFRGKVPVLETMDVTGFSEILQDRHTGLIHSHHDYWDASVHFYGRLPLIGPVLRWIANKASV
ncbi:nuclear transport factor 2 family protein [Kiloniella sp. b19]|uniref:nuclear transport factor 2 family protein n=1 Tax=Kiloniella sp. GXU_MW_B19 TaxID=3141326 RepID=UPI0031D1E9AC